MNEDVKNVDKSKKNKIYVVIIIFLLLIIFSMGMYIFVDKSGFFEKVESSEDVKDSELIDGETDEDVIVKELDLNKPLNTTGITYFNPRDDVNDFGISMSINADKKSVTLSIDWNVFSGAVGNLDETPSYQIIGFNKEVKDVFVGTFGQEVGGLTLLFLMSDGTVEYVPMFGRDNLNCVEDYSADGSIIGKHFVSKGALTGVINVVKFYNVNAATQTGWFTSIGATADGSFYDLGNIIYQS